MDDTPPPQPARDDAPTGRRRKGLSVPLPAVVVGLGLASAPAVAQIPVVARDDVYVIPMNTSSVLPVMGNDTLNNAAPTFFDSFSPPKGSNVVAQQFSLLFTPPNGFEGTLTFPYCIESFSPGTNSCATVTLIVGAPATPVPALGGAALVGLSGVLGWLGMRLRRRG